MSVSAARKNGNITVTVSDTGTEIAPELLSHIFERGIKGPDGGAGIGLAISRQIMEAHGGAITITSGNGAMVNLTLPEYPEGGQHEH